MKKTTTQTLKKASMRFAALLAAIAAPSAFAASQTWSNAPQNALWAGSSNWIANATPGGINLTGNTLNNDVATFNSPLAGGIGGAGNPILVDDATVAAARSRHLGGLTFDGADCGAYVVTSLSPQVLPATGIPATGILYVSHNQTTRVNAAVTNIQTITVPMRVRLPSSTAGQYFIRNDSTNASSGLIISTIIHDGATTRATTFNLGGVNAGENNIITNLSEGVGNATGGFTKTGVGTWKLAGTGTFPGASPLNINEGTLAVLAADAFGAATTATVTNGTLRFDGVTLNQFSLNLRNGGNLQANGTVAVNGVAVGNQAGNSCTLSTLNASDVFTVGTFAAANSIVSGGAADSVLNTAGSGTLVFGQANTYIGRWNFAAATNQITSPVALSTGANANVGAGAIFDFSAQGAVSFAPTTAGFGGSGVGSVVGSTAAAVIADAGGTLDLAGKNINLNFNPASFSGDLTRPALTMAQGTLALGGNTFFVNNTSGTPLGTGTYRLVTQASGSITSGGGYAALISGSGMVGGAAAAIVVSGGNVDLVISIYVPKNLTWTGGNPDTTWDVTTTANWLDGVTPSVFNSSDNVTFNSIGSTNPSVSLVGTLAPATVTVDTSANDYTFSGVGQIAGTTGLTKTSAGVLNLNTVNTYAGGTVVSNGMVRIGANNAISAVGAGDVAVYSPGVIDLNGFNNGVNALLGNGTIDNQSGGASVLTVGNNDDSGTFSGTLANTSGTLGVTKVGTGQITLTSANTHAGPTIVNTGTLEVQNPNAFGSGTLTINGGALRTTSSLNLNSLTGADGTTFANAAGATTTILTHTGTGNYTGIISDGASGSIGIYIPSGTLQLNGNNTYSGSTIVASGATLAIGVRNPGGSGTAGTGGITASNNATVSMPTSLSTSAQVPNNITNVDVNGTVYFPSPGQANSYNGQFIGGANATNIFSGNMTIGGAVSFANFGGTVVVSNGANMRYFTGTGIDGGGDNTTFLVEGNMFNRDARNTRIGALIGSGSIGGPSVSGPATMIIGAKNLSTTFSGFVAGNNNIVKSGTGSLTLNGVRYWTNTVTLADPFEPTNIVSFTLYSNVVTYVGNTTVSNGTLTIVAPNNLNNSTNITLAGGTLNVSSIGYATNQTTIDYNSVEQPTNTVVTTTGVLDILSGQTLNGTGNVTGSVNAQAGSTVNPGLGIGTMAVSGSVSLNGTVNMDLNRSNLAQNSDRITAASFSGSGSTLNITNVGPTLLSGSTYQLFSGSVSAFTTVNLPTTSVDGSITYVWVNNIAVDGTITLTSGLNPAPAPITTVVNGSNLELSWPADHTGWTLQAQTNSLNIGLSGTWFNVAGSAATNQVIVPVNPANPTVFYRLTLPLP